LVRWREPQPPHRTVSKQFRRSDDARSFKLDIERTIDRREYVAEADRAVPLQSYLAGILASSTELRPSSLDVYGATLRHHIQGTRLGESPIGRISSTLLREYWASLAIGNGARRSLYQLLAKAFNAAVRDGIFAVSPFRRAGIKSPSKSRQKEIHPLGPGEIEALADAARGRKERLAILLMGYAGLRAGEVGGLRVQDVDFLKRSISVRQAAWRVNGERGVGPVKTAYSRRSLRIPNFLVDELSAYLRDHNTAPDGRILHGRNFAPIEHIVVNKMVHAAAKRAGLPPVHAHALRHSCAAMLIKHGAHPKAIQAFMGHSSISVTMDVYGHLLPGGGEELAAGLEKMRADGRANRTLHLSSGAG
jgi:integrase